MLKHVISHSPSDLELQGVVKLKPAEVLTVTELTWATRALEDNSCYAYFTVRRNNLKTLNKSWGYYVKYIVVKWHLILWEKFRKHGQLFLMLLIPLTSRGQSKTMKVVVFFRSVVFYQNKGIWWRCCVSPTQPFEMWQQSLLVPRLCLQYCLLHFPKRTPFGLLPLSQLWYISLPGKIRYFLNGSHADPFWVKTIKQGYFFSFALTNSNSKLDQRR